MTIILVHLNFEPFFFFLFVIGTPKKNCLSSNVTFIGVLRKYQKLMVSSTTVVRITKSSGGLKPGLNSWGPGSATYLGPILFILIFNFNDRFWNKSKNYLSIHLFVLQNNIVFS